MVQSILVIGGGIAGLATGCYGQMNGYKTQIFEMHTVPGGLCTGWKRKEYTFDGCIHWLAGSNPESPMNQLWQELGVAQGRPIVNYEYYVRCEGKDGRTLTFYTDIDRLEAHLKEFSPADAKWIDELCSAIRQLSRMEMQFEGPEGILASLSAGAKMLPLIPTLNKWAKLTVVEMAERFQDPLLRRTFTNLYGADGATFSALAFVMMMGMMYRKDAGYPIGGSLEFARAMERRYLALGGTIHYSARVTKILVEEDRAVGVRLADGSEYRGDVIVSAADGHTTIFEMLEGKYIDDTIRGYYETLPIFRPTVQVSLGINRDFSAEPHALYIELDSPLSLDGTELPYIMFRHFCADPTMAPAGKSVVTTFFMADYEYWKALGADRAAYEAEKRRVADQVIAALDRRFPGSAAQIEVVDVATPLTTERYTGNWKGSMEGWLFTPETMKLSFGKGMRKTLPGLKNFYMAGQWVEPGGGIPTGGMAGRKLIQELCKQEGKPFTTTVL